MKALIMMLFNVKEETYHPIMYFEHPFAGEDNDVYRFKSKGHRTIGFKDREEALASIEKEVTPQLKKYEVYKELEGDIPWDGEETPADNQLRNKESLEGLLVS